MPPVALSFPSCRNSVGADDSVRPLGSCEFAADFHKKQYNLPGRCGHRPLHWRGSVQGSLWAQGELAAKLTEGIRTWHILEHSEPCNVSPPSFSSKMPPPLIVRGTTRGGFGTSVQNTTRIKSIYTIVPPAMDRSILRFRRCRPAVTKIPISSGRPWLPCVNETVFRQ